MNILEGSPPHPFRSGSHVVWHYVHSVGYLLSPCDCLVAMEGPGTTVQTEGTEDDEQTPNLQRSPLFDCMRCFSPSGTAVRLCHSQASLVDILHSTPRSYPCRQPMDPCEPGMKIKLLFQSLLLYPPTSASHPFHLCALRNVSRSSDLELRGQGGKGSQREGG